MLLFNVRKGQFVYYKNQLHKVYSVKPFFKQSVHLIRLNDFEQVLSTAREIEYYRPQHLDSFIWNRQRYTLHKDTKANVGDYILVTNPRPDSLDRHYLNSIELVSSLESNGVITNHSNGIKHNEYWVMLPGKHDGATIIDYQDPDIAIEDKDLATAEEIIQPKIGDIFENLNTQPIVQAMVVAVQGKKVYLGNDFEVRADELMDDTKWRFVQNAFEK